MSVRTRRSRVRPARRIASARLGQLRPSRGTELRSSIALICLLREKHEGLNRGNADPPASW